jgi:hypothetical protein
MEIVTIIRLLIMPVMYRCKDLQSLSSHVLISVELPGQSPSAVNGDGFEHILDRVRIPPLQLSLHASHGCHFDQTSAKQNILILN